MQTASIHGYDSGELALSANLEQGPGGMRMDKEEKMLMIWCSFSMAHNLFVKPTSIHSHTTEACIVKSLLWHSVIVQTS